MAGELRAADGFYSFVCICRGFFMYFSQLDLKSLLVGNLGFVNCRLPCVKADQPQDQCRQKLWELAPKPWGVSFGPRRPIW